MSSEVAIAIEKLKSLPPSRQQEVLDFIEFLQAKEQIADEASTQQEAELEYVDGLLVVKAQGTPITASLVEDMREERIREIGGW